MPTRQNPFYQYQNPGIGQALDGLAATMFPGGQSPINAAHGDAYAASAEMSRAHAGKYLEETRGKRNENNAAITTPQALAELFMTGGNLKDDMLQRNPDYVERQPVDMSLTAKPDNTPISSMFMPYASAQDKMAAAIQEANIRGMKLDDVLKSAGLAEYLRRAGGTNPDSGLAFAPFAGVHAPNTQTALSTGRQDAISARDSAEAKSLEGVRQAGETGRNNTRVFNAPVTTGNNADTIVSPARGKALGLQPDENGQYVIRGRATVGTGQDQMPGSLGGEAVAGREKTTNASGGPANKTSAVPVAASKRMQSIIEKSMADKGITVNPETMSGLLAEAGTAWQTSKNPDAAADDIVQRLGRGESINGVSVNVEQRMLRSDKKSLARTPGGAADPLAQARDAIAKGAPRAAVIKRLKDNGIEPTGL
jgi:hypothetical protein